MRLPVVAELFTPESAMSSGGGAGHGQLVGSLRQDPRVVNLERTNLGRLSVELVPEPIEVVTADLSYRLDEYSAGPCVCTTKPAELLPEAVGGSQDHGPQLCDSNTVTACVIHQASTVTNVTEMVALRSSLPSLPPAAIRMS